MWIAIQGRPPRCCLCLPEIATERSPYRPRDVLLEALAALVEVTRKQVQVHPGPAGTLARAEEPAMAEAEGDPREPQDP